MEKIRNGTEQDLPEIRRLWAECFGDDAFAGWFFLRLYDPNYLRVIEVDGAVVSMAFCFPRTLVLSGKEFSAWYLYGIATTRSARGNGYAKKLISACTAEARALGAELCFLIPAEPSLFAFYRGCGFDLVWERKTETCAVEPVDFAITVAQLEWQTPQIQAIYEQMWRGYFKRSSRDWVLLSESFRQENGALYEISHRENPIGYCFAVKQDDLLEIRELGLVYGIDAERVCHALGKTLGCKTWRYTCPGQSEPLAAVFPFTDVIRSAPQGVHCDLMYN